MNIKGSQTEKNLLKAFAGESQARNRYTFFASKAKKEGYRQISEIFAETANQEKEHAERFFKFLEGGMVEITDTYPAGAIGDTLSNLKAAAEGEHYEWETMYPTSAKIAKEEGFEDIAQVFLSISVAEKHHEERYLKLASNIEESKVFKREKEITWSCLNCGYRHKGVSAPDVCPACNHTKAHFALFKNNY